MRDKAKQLIQNSGEGKFEGMHFDNFVGLDCVDDGLNMGVGTGAVLFYLIL